MLSELYIKNYILVKELRYSFSDGLTVISGETGAGKSIVVGSIGLVFGDNASGLEAWDKEQPIYLEALFKIPEDPELKAYLEQINATDEEELALAREISPTGKSTYFLNGRRSSASVLKELKGFLLDFHHQRDQQRILQSAYQLELLDRFAQLAMPKEEFSTLYYKVKSQEQELNRLIAERDANQQLRELYQYQYEELVEADLKVGEDLELQRDFELNSNASQIIGLIGDINQALFEAEGSINDRLSYYLNKLQLYHQMNQNLCEAKDALNEAISSLQDCSFALSKAGDSIHFDPAKLDALQERLNLINSLLFKHKVNNINDLVELFESRKAELKAADHLDGSIALLEKELKVNAESLKQKADDLTKIRREQAKILAEKLKESIRRLAIKDAEFEIRIDKISNADTLNRSALSAYNDKGQDLVTFLFSANLGSSPKPLSQVASGGEMSRILLGMKEILASVQSARLIILDEIDIGIGGKTADQVARCIYQISRTNPVLCITHLAQIAAYADHHIAVSKLSDQKTSVQLKSIEAEEQIVEIARMLSGQITEASRSHANELLKLKTTT